MTLFYVKLHTVVLGMYWKMLALINYKNNGRWQDPSVPCWVSLANGGCESCCCVGSEGLSSCPELPENWTDTRETLLEGMLFSLKYLGMTLVEQPKGEELSAAAVKRIVATVSTSCRGSQEPEPASFWGVACPLLIPQYELSLPLSPLVSGLGTLVEGIHWACGVRVNVLFSSSCGHSLSQPPLPQLRPPA